MFRLFKRRAAPLVTTAPAANKSEEPTFSEVVIYYCRVFDLGRNVNPTVAARALLGTEVALAAANYLTDDVELAAHFGILRGLRQDAQFIADFSSRLDNDGLLSAVKWAMGRPRIFASWFRRYRQLGRTHRSDNGDSSIETEHEADGRSVQDIVRDTITSLDESMVQTQNVISLHRYSDRILFSPTYLEEVPFTRLELQPFYATIDGEDLAIDVWLLIHRSGVAILTFAAMFNNPKTTDELIRLQVASKALVTRSEVVRAVVEPQARAHGIGRKHMDTAPFKRRSSSGVEWFSYEDQAEITLDHIFDLYQGAATVAVLNKKPKKPGHPWDWLRSGHWLNYPIVFVRRVTPICSTDEEFKSLYPGHLAGLIMRFPGWRELRPDRIAAARALDFATTTNHSIFVESSHATVLYYDSYHTRSERQHQDEIPGQDWLFAHFQVSSVVDMLLVQRWIVDILNSQLRRVSFSLRSLNAFKRDLLLGLGEYQNVTVAFGSAQDIIAAGRELMGIENAHAGVLAKLSTIEKLVEVEESRRRYVRDLRMRVGATLVTLLLGLAGARQVVEVVASWNMVSTQDWGLLATIWNAAMLFLDSHPTRSTLILYCAIVTLIAVTMLWGTSLRGVRRPIIAYDQSGPAEVSHFTWPIQFSWTGADDASTQDLKAHVPDTKESAK